MATTSRVDRLNAIRRKRSPMRTARKRCGKCGAVGFYRPQNRQCRMLTGLLGTYLCGGELRDARPARPAKPEPKPQDVAQKKLEHCRRMAERARQAGRKAAQAVTRHARSERQWEARARYYAQRASMTDAEIEAERAQRKEQAEQARARRARRAIALDGRT